MPITIRDHRLVGLGVTQRAATNMGGVIDPSLIVVHDTAGRLDKGSSVAWFASHECKTSAHIVIERDGSVVQMVPLNRKAFHAGESGWRDRRYCNGFSIGIEVVSPGLLDRDGRAWFGPAVPADTPLEYRDTPEHGMGWWLAYTPAQIDAVKAVCRAIVLAYPACDEIATHWQISPGRKIDTGPLFPLADVTAYALDATHPTARVLAAWDATLDTSARDDVVAESPAQQNPKTAPIPQPPTPVAVTARDLAAGGSRTMTTLLRMQATFKALLGMLGGLFTLDNLGLAKGYVDAIKNLASDNASLLVGVGVVGGFALALYASGTLVAAANDGRYATSTGVGGGEPKPAADPAA